MFDIYNFTSGCLQLKSHNSQWERGDWEATLTRCCMLLVYVPFKAAISHLLISPFFIISRLHQRSCIIAVQKINCSTCVFTHTDPAFRTRDDDSVSVCVTFTFSNNVHRFGIHCQLTSSPAGRFLVLVFTRVTRSWSL